MAVTHFEPREADAEFTTRYGSFRLMAFSFPSGNVHAVLVKGDLSSEVHPLVRVQSACLTATALGATGCDCADQMHQSMELVCNEEVGCIIYLDQEGMGHGLLEKVAHFREMNSGLDTVEAALKRGVAPDVRDYSEAAAILKQLIGEIPIRLLTNNPEKEKRLKAAGVAVLESLPIEPDPTDANRAYLRVKKQKLHHRLSKV